MRNHEVLDEVNFGNEEDYFIRILFVFQKEYCTFAKK